MERDPLNAIKKAAKQMLNVKFTTKSSLYETSR